MGMFLFYCLHLVMLSLVSSHLNLLLFLQLLLLNFLLFFLTELIQNYSILFHLFPLDLVHIFLMKLSFRKSMVRVEEEAMTREDRVDMEAESTRMTTRAINPSDRLESMVGMTES